MDNRKYPTMLMRYVCLCIVLVCGVYATARGQFSASPSNWLYPYGNAEATRQQFQRSGTQSFDSVSVKWISTDIYGDVQPLVGNIVNNPKIVPSNPWAPNEIAAVIAGRLVVLGGNGKTVASAALPSFIKNVSVLFDSTALLPDAFTIFPVIMGLEVIEHEAGIDSVARTYVAGYSTNSSQIEIIKRVAVDLRPYAPNNSASIAPVFGRSDGTEMTLYSVVNMSNPSVFSSSDVTPQFFRGLSVAGTRDFRFPFPRPDVLDNLTSRYTIGPDVSGVPPSISAINGTGVKILLPCFPSLNMRLAAPIDNPFTDLTQPDRVYLFDMEMGGADGLAQGSAWQELTAIQAIQRPRIRPLFVHLTDAGAGGVESPYVLVAEEYSGRDNSVGQSTLHLFDNDGVPLTFVPPAADEATTAFLGRRNHYWSIATGDIDGSGGNESLPYYPNNPGNEIVATYSSPDFAVANNRLMVLRYRTGTRIEKPTTQRDSLYSLDTIATQTMGGWVAAVNDFDGAPDNKAEIFVIDGTVLRVLRMRDYDDVTFRLGYPFDTVAVFPFGTESISSLAIGDLDGDGLNDILVTTSQRTYLIGKSVLGVLDVIDPVVQNTPPDAFCHGDVVPIRWVNFIGGNPTAHVYFQPYSGGVPSGPRRLIAQNVDNSRDTVIYQYTSNVNTLTGDGRFIVESTLNSSVRDSTAILRFLPSSITLDTPVDGTVYRIGEMIPVSGATVCLDSVIISITTSRADTAWQEIARVQVQADGSYAYTYELPCIPLFNCLEADVDSVLRFRATGFQNRTGGIVLTTASHSVVVRPDSLVLTQDPPPAVACPERVFRWTVLDAPLGCDVFLVSMSLDSGKTFAYIDTVATSDELYTWHLPVGLPDTVLVRFCCLEGCARTDIIVPDATVRYVNIVAPNPFDPLVPSSQEKPGVNVIYALDKAMSVTITIVDQSNRIVARPVINQERNPKVVYCDNWDGYIEGTDKVAANGMYYLILETSSGKREVYPVYVAKGY